VAKQENKRTRYKRTGIKQIKDIGISGWDLESSD
jgi:hypothetical protein